MTDKYIRAADLALRWGVTTRRINQLCAQDYLPGALKEGKFWMIPVDVQKPSVLRKKRTEQYYASKLLPCPVGITSFREIAKECYYVDKTLLIKDVIDDHNKVYLFTRPRRFGKTLTMNMLKTFFEKTEEDTSVYFSDKAIWSAGKKYQEYQGKYPVIFLSFKDAHQQSWSEMYHCLFYSVKEAYLNHLELLESEKLNEFDRKFFRNIAGTDASSIDVQFSLGKLTSMLAKHWGQKVVILIDDYDVPIRQAYLNGYYELASGFLRNFLSAGLKDNRDLAFGIMTGVLSAVRDNMLSGVNNLTVYTVMDEKYSQYFGFTPEEVSEIAHYYGKEETLSEIRNWYGGYLFGNTEIYNPCSVVSFFSNNCIPRPFWSGTEENEMMQRLLTGDDSETYQRLASLMQGKELHAMIDPDIFNPEANGNPGLICSFLLAAGYLRITKVIGEPDSIPICSLAVPNREIQSVFRKEILSLFANAPGGSLPQI